MVKNLPAMQETQETRDRSLGRGREDPLEKETATHSSILAWESHGERSLAGCSPRAHKELDMTGTTEHAHTHKIFLRLSHFT